MQLTKEQTALVIRCLRERVKSISDLIRDHGHRMPAEAIELFMRDQDEARALAQRLDFRDGCAEPLAARLRADIVA